MASRKKDKRYMDVEISLNVTFREPDGDPQETRNDVKVWLHNRMLRMQHCRSVDIKNVSVTPVTILAADRGEED